MRRRSIWALREFQSLQGVNDACRGAGFLCQLGHSEFRRPVGVPTNVAILFDKLHRGWPLLSQREQDLKYEGSLPNHCPCVPQHNNLRGVDAAVISFLHLPPHWASGSGIGFLEPSSLRDGSSTSSTLASQRSSTSSSLEASLSSGSALSSGSGSLRTFYDSWKHGAFTPFKAAEVLSSEGIASYFGSSAPSRLSPTTRFSRSSVWRYSSSALPLYPRVSSSTAQATPTAYAPGTSRSRTPRST